MRTQFPNKYYTYYLLIEFQGLKLNVCIIELVLKIANNLPMRWLRLSASSVANFFNV